MESFSEGFAHDTSTPSDNKYRVTADSSLRVREGPEIKPDNIIGNLILNEVVEKLDENEDRTWFKIRNASGTLTGWCSAEFLEIFHERDIEPIRSTMVTTANPATDTTTNPAKGVTRIEGNRFGTHFYLTICNPADVRIEVVHEDSIPSAIARQAGAKFGFNGDDWDRATRKVIGMEICNGKVRQKRKSSEPSLIVTKDGKAFIASKNIPGQSNVTSGVRFLVKDGANVIPSNSTDPKHTEKHARSVRGLHADGRVMFLTVDGDFIHSGMTLGELAILMLEFGCVIAFDGGGGGDSVDVVDGIVVSVPDDQSPDGMRNERRVPQTILVFTKESN